MSNTDEALKIWNALKPMVDKEIEAKTRSCVRAKKMTVTTAPADGLVGVTESYGLEVQLPYSSKLEDLQVGDAVWAWYFYNNASTMIVLSKGDGQLTDEPPITPGTITVALPDTSLESSWTTESGIITSGPTTATSTLSFVVSGVPEGATVESVSFSATFGSPYTGAATLTANGSPVGVGAQTVSLTPTETGNGTYAVTLVFQANGDASLADGDHSGSVSVSSPTVTVSYTG